MMSYISLFDLRVLQYLYVIRDRTLVIDLINVTELGGVVFILGITACLALYFFLTRKVSYIAGLLFTVGGAAAIAFLLKHVVARARPDVWYRAYPETGFSFPSGHSTLSAALYGFCVYLIWRSSLPKMWRIGLSAALTILIATIAFSRLYLGVHYVSDVIGGLLLGAAFAWLGATFSTRFDAWASSDTLITRALFRRQ